MEMGPFQYESMNLGCVGPIFIDVLLQRETKLGLHQTKKKKSECENCENARNPFPLSNITAVWGR